MKCSITDCNKEAKLFYADEHDPGYVFCGKQCAHIWFDSFTRKN